MKKLLALLLIVCLIAATAVCLTACNDDATETGTETPADQTNPAGDASSTTPTDTQTSSGDAQPSTNPDTASGGGNQQQQQQQNPDTSSGGGNQQQQQNPPAATPTSYSVARTAFQEWFGIPIPEKTGIDVSFDIGGDSFCFDMVGGDNLSAATFTEFVTYFDELFDVANSAAWEREPMGGNCVNYENTALGKGINLYYDDFNTAVYLNVFYNNTTFDKYAFAKGIVSEMLGVTLPESMAVNATYIHAQLYNGYGGFGYYNIAEFETVYNAYKTCLDALAAPWNADDPVVNGNRTTVTYDNNTNGARIELSKDADSNSVSVDAGFFGVLVATTFAQAREVLADVYGVELPDIAGVTLGDNSFSLAGDEVTFAFSGDTLTKQYCIDNIEAVFVTLCGNAGNVTSDGADAREISWTYNSMLYSVSWTAASGPNAPMIDINMMCL